MTSGPVTTALEYHCDPVSPLKFTFARLEFGKYCVSPDGPVESNRDNIPTGYSQLGWSRDFPRELISICHPTSIGIVNDEGEKQPLENVHGTVVRPIVRGKIWPVVYRIRSRAEGGEGQAGRLYTLGRYLCSPKCSGDPLTMMLAMDSAGLRGMTKLEAQDIPSIQVDAAALKIDSVVEAFLAEALIYVLSGIPLSITEEISELQFFTLAAFLHQKLPLPIQPHLSAGWNVGSSFSGRLGITYTMSRAASAALFSPRTLTWLPPEYVTTWNAQYEPISNPFFEARLEPGRLFQEYIPVNPSSDLVDSLPTMKLPELPCWNDASTVRVLRYPGLQARDQFALAALARWLGDGTGDPRLYLDVRKLSYQSNRLKALHLILSSAGQVNQRRRADEALWLSVDGKVHSSFTTVLNGTTGPGADRARLLAALGGGDVSESIRALVVAARDTDDLYREAGERLSKILDQSITPAYRAGLAFHVQLLRSRPSPYVQWVNRNALQLMGALALDEATPAEAFDAIVEIEGSDLVLTLHALIRGESPPRNLPAQLSARDSRERKLFTNVFHQQWKRADGQTAQRRESLLTWFRLLRPESRHPLLRLELGEELTDTDLDEVAAEVEGQRVPVTQHEKIAVLALRRLPVFGLRVISRPNWQVVTSLWPSDYARALVARDGTESPAQAVLQATRELRVPANELSTLIKATYADHTFKQTAPLLWDLALRLERRLGSRITLIDLCTHISVGILPDGELASGDDSELFERLAGDSGKLSLASRQIQEMWAKARKPWQIGLLLPLFPQEDLVPSALQLSKLVPYRQWLLTHLANPHIHVHRRNRFRLATESFNSLSYKNDFSWWNEDFVGYAIWAAFKGVPARSLPKGSLRQALRAYSQVEEEPATGQQPLPLIEQQARMCCDFLQAYERSPSQDSAMDLVLNDFILPLLAYQGSQQFAEDAFDRVGAQYDIPGYVRPDRYHHFSQPLQELLRRLIVFVPRKTLLSSIRNFYKQQERKQND